RRRSHGHRGRARRRAVGPDAAADHAGLAARAGVLAGLPARRGGAVPGPLLRLPVAVRVLDAGPGAVAELRADVRLLGAGRALLVPPDRLLVRAAGGG